MSKDFIPNSFLCPNAIVDKLMAKLTDAEFRVLAFMIRHILGWETKRPTRKAAISQSVFVNGFTHTEEDGSVTAYGGCGLQEAALKKALNSLVDFKIVSRGKLSNDGQEWVLAFLLGSQINMEAIDKRYQSWQEKANAKTEKARHFKAAKQGGMCDTPPLSHIPPEGMSHNPPEGMSDNPQQIALKQHVNSTIAPNGAGVDLSEKITYLEPDTPPKPPTPVSAPPPSPRKRNLMFDAVAEHIFKIDGDQLPDEMPDGLIGAVSAWLEGKSDGMRQGRKKLVVGKISRPAEPQHVRMFAEDWQRDHPGASMPLSFEKIVNHWRAWASKKNGARPVVPAHRPVTVPDDIELTPDEIADIKAQARRATA